MAKYVEFIYDNGSSEFEEVQDYSIESVKKLNHYNENWYKMVFVEGNKRMFDEKILDIYPATLIKTIYKGKKVSYEIVRQLVGNNLKYKDLLVTMNINCRNAFSSLNLNIQDDEEYSRKLEEFKKEFYKTHFCLFSLPDNFGANAFMDEKSITLEEFDETFKIDYSEDLKVVGQNTMAGEEYIKKHKFILELFHNYFEMLIHTCRSYPVEHQEIVFNTCYFHFENFEDLSSLDDVNFFLDICDYTYGFSNFNKDLFSNYRKFVNKIYEELENGVNLN